jgi:DNA anti-recombination protein RmuC
MVDLFTLVTGVTSAGALLAVLYLILMTRKRNPAQDQNTDVAEIKGAVSTLNSSLTDVISRIGEMKSSTEQMTKGISDIQTFADLFKGSSQKRGQAGEIMIRQYLETLPREMWESQFTIPGGSGRVDYVIRINNNGKQTFLPIDSKFSMPESDEDFEDSANKKALARVQDVLQYLTPGITTDFVVMVLPNPVYYSLKYETIRLMADQKVLPTPVDGVMVFCSLALRAHQAMVLEQSATQLGDFAQKVRDGLTAILVEVKPLEKNLKSAHKYIEKTHHNIEESISELDGITTHLPERKSLATVPDKAVLAPDLLTTSEEQD